jgi:hypothetical protein
MVYDGDDGLPLQSRGIFWHRVVADIHPFLEMHD